MKQISKIFLAVSALFCMASALASAAPADDVTGVVKDAKGEPIVGALIVDDAKKATAITNLDGEFTINPTTPGISVSCLGYLNKSLKVKAGQRVTIILEDDVTLLEETVIVGYAVQSRKNVTGAVATVDVGTSVVGRSVPDLGRGLQGAAAGLSVTIPDAEVGSDPRIKIRGAIGSIEGGSSPLILLDNVEIPSIQVVNPEDIESVSVLKDAASTSIYGSKGAFGVILLTSKKGARTDKVTVNFTSLVTWQNMAKDYDMADVDGIQYVLDASARSKDSAHKGVNYNYDGISVFSYVKANAESLERTKAWKAKYGNTLGPNDPVVYGRDWYYDGSTIYGIRPYNVYDYMVAEWAPTQQHNASINGMVGNTTFNVGLGYLDESGMMKTAKNDSFQKYNASVKLETEVNKWLKVRAGMMYSQRQKNYPFITDQTSYSPWLYLYRWSCLFPYGYDEMGNEIRGAASEARQANTATRRYNYTNVNLGATITPVQNWNIVADYSYANQDYIMTLPGCEFSGADYRYTDTPLELMKDDQGRQIYVNWDGDVVPSTDPDAMAAYHYGYKSPYTPTSDNRYYARQSENSYRHTFNGYTDYTIFAGGHTIKAMLGMNLSTYNWTSQYTKVMTLSDYQNPQFAFGTGVWTGDGSASWDSQLGFFGRLNYNYKERYLFEANLRRDGSSKFPTALKWAWFPSFSGAWRIIEEPWMADLKPYVSTFKIRASWGSVGDQSVSSSLYIPTLSTGVNSWISNGSQTSYVSTPSTVSAAITWQKIQTADIGIDTRFFDSHVGLSFDWFNRDTKDMIVPTDGVNSVTFGSSAPKANNGWLRTNGWELSIDGNWRFDNGLGVNATFNLADSKSTIMKYGDTKSLSSWYVGKEYGEIWGFQVDRLYQDYDFEHDSEGNLIYRELTADDTDDPACIGKYAYILKAGPNGEKPVYQAYYQGGSFIYGPGDVKYKDVDGDGKLSWGTKTTDDHGDWSKIGNSNPRYEYSLRLGADWKGVDFSVLLQGVGKREIWGKGPLCVAGCNTGDGAMAAAIAADYWTPENTDAFWPAAYAMDRYANSSYNYICNDRYLLNMAYLRVKNLTVGYTLPAKWTKAISIQKVRTYFTAENFLTFDKLRGLPIDPECITGYSMWGDSYAQGNTGLNTPVFKSVSLGVQVTF